MARVSGLWIGSPLSPLERACIASFLTRGHQFDLFTYEEIPGVPDGCRVLDAAEVLPRERVFAHSAGVGRGSVAAFSDCFRYELLYRHGGWWVDLDVFCLTDSLPDAGFVVGRQGPTIINSAILRAPAGHPVVAAARSACETKSSEVEWGELGPDLLTRLMRQHGLDATAFPPEVFYPVDWQHYWAVLDPRRAADVLNRMRSAACIHLWNEMLRRIQFDKNVLPPQGSVLRSLYEASIGVSEFTHEYALAVDCAPNALQLEIRSRCPEPGVPGTFTHQ
ncbi:hypothetical protein HNQ60_000820 [Povalibacter uvarum]|uniref:Alpha 1,4-glycosyltransferase domain-containing protein n=1 Tax=Povalibacter uvarum TaxID=732238 RepID=A0A841HHD2_9GAMM|nr:capsular polysaccharide synthesis protein [Povalibacter uvarum]MBB6091974.1 hypothetical protein [Povalibacter uvarum]